MRSPSRCPRPLSFRFTLLNASLASPRPRRGLRDAGEDAVTVPVCLAETTAVVIVKSYCPARGHRDFGPHGGRGEVA